MGVQAAGWYILASYGSGLGLGQGRSLTDRGLQKQTASNSHRIQRSSGEKTPGGKAWFTLDKKGSTYDGGEKLSSVPEPRI